jgi:hypothetical protein
MWRSIDAIPAKFRNSDVIEQLVELRRQSKTVYVSEQLKRYIVRLVRATRHQNTIGPRPAPEDSADASPARFFANYKACAPSPICAVVPMCCRGRQSPGSTCCAVLFLITALRRGLPTDQVIQDFGGEIRRRHDLAALLVFTACTLADASITPWTAGVSSGSGKFDPIMEYQLRGPFVNQLGGDARRRYLLSMSITRKKTFSYAPRRYESSMDFGSIR